eukprot:c36346_g1_i1 orf=315-671(+)
MSFVKMALEDEMKSNFLLCPLLDSLDELIVGINSMFGTLKFEDVVSTLMNVELRQKTFGVSKIHDALITHVRGRKLSKGPSRQRRKSQSKSRSIKDIKCFHCGKLGHLKKNWQRNKQT